MVFNCVVVTHQDHGSEYYRLFVYQIVDNIARQVEMRNIRVFVHQASANHYVPRTNYEENDESDEIRSYNLPSKYKMMAEQAILQRDVNAVIARTAVVYGPTDRSGITTELLIAYMISRDQIELPAKMEPDKPHYTIHAIDAARAMLHLAKWYVQHQCEDVQVFNVCDVGRTTVIDFNRRYAEIYPHKFRYLPIPRAVPSLKQQEDVREMTNEFFGERWLRILREANIKQAPVSPFAYRESVSPAAIAVSNARLVATGFTFKYPVLTANALRQTIYEFTKQGVWPTATGPIPPPSNLN
jgi:nucleoside-diphosphate-sugar epimerase